MVYQPTNYCKGPSGSGVAHERDPRTEGKTWVSRTALSAFYKQEINDGNPFYYFFKEKNISHPLYVRFNQDGSEDVVEKGEDGSYNFIRHLKPGEGHWYPSFLFEISSRSKSH